MNHTRVACVNSDATILASRPAMSLEDNVDGSDLHVLRLIRDLDNATHMVAQYHVRPHQVWLRTGCSHGVQLDAEIRDEF